jgi:UDP-N-acetylmuramoyl-tripeptide--D-alanyl-D-alanine ligase
MTLWSATDLARATGGTIRAPFAADGVSIDSRSIRTAEIFVALEGESGDGHDFAARALSAGAAGVMTHRDAPGLAAEAPELRVADTLVGLTDLGRFARARFAGHLVAVTGSVGKTTTKEMLRRVLEAEGPTHAARASYNNHWGVPLTLACLPPTHRFCVAEIGMNHAGEIAPLARLARPHVAIITTTDRAHIGHLGSLEAIADEKAAIFGGLEPGGVAILPSDSPLFDRLAACAGAARVIRFGASVAAEARLVDATVEAEATRLRADILGIAIECRLAAPGRHMAMNAVATLAAAAALGLDPATAARALDGFAPVVGRGMRRPIALPDGEATLIDESYNASAPSVRAALAVLRGLPARRRIAVLGDMLELGDHAEAEHLGLRDDVAEAADLVFACGHWMGRLVGTLPVGIRGAVAPDSAALASAVAEAIRPGDAVLVKGSLGMGMKRIVEALSAAPGAR